MNKSNYKDFLIFILFGRDKISILPLKNYLGFYEIRLESIGGLGANLAGQMLAKAGVLGHGLNGVNFSTYGCGHISLSIYVT